MSRPTRPDPTRPSAYRFWKLVLGSVGVVYGDIGTSPLYALREALRAAGRDGLERERGDRHRLAAALDADPHRHAEIRHLDPARRQPRRGRHAVAAGAGAAGARPADRLLFVLGGRRRRALLRRRGDHPGDLGPVGGRGPRAGRRRASTPTSCRSPSAILVVLFWVQSHGTARVSVFFGPITLLWFVVMAVLGSTHVGDRPVIFARLQSRRGDRSSWSATARLAAGDGLGVPRGHRRRGALRRHGPLRPRPDPHRLVRPGLPGAGAQLPRPGQPGARQPGGRRPTPSSCWRPSGACCRWCCSPPAPRSSPARR